MSKNPFIVYRVDEKNRHVWIPEKRQHRDEDKEELERCVGCQMLTSWPGAKYRCTGISIGVIFLDKMKRPGEERMRAYRNAANLTAFGGEDIEDDK